MSDHAELARAFYRAFSEGDRAFAERILADDFRFSSPLDNAIDRTAFFRLCWPGSGSGDPFAITHLAEDGDTVLVVYESGSGTNGEALTFRDDRLVETRVFFGWSLPHPVPEGEHRDPE